MRPFRFFIQDFRWAYLSLDPFVTFIRSVMSNMSLVFLNHAASDGVGLRNLILTMPVVSIAFLVFFFTVYFILIFDVILSACYTFCRGIVLHHERFKMGSLAVNSNDYRTIENLERPKRFIDKPLVRHLIWAYDLLTYSLVYGLYLMVYACFLIISLNLFAYGLAYLVLLIGVPIWKFLYAYSIVSLKPYSLAYLSHHTLGSLLESQNSLILYIAGNLKILGGLTVLLGLILRYFKTQYAHQYLLVPILARTLERLCHRMSHTPIFPRPTWVLNARRRIGNPVIGNPQELNDNMDQYADRWLFEHTYERAENRPLDNHLDTLIWARTRLLQEFVSLQAILSIAAEKLQLESETLKLLLAIQQQAPTDEGAIEINKKKEVIAILETEIERLCLYGQRMKERAIGAVNAMNVSRFRFENSQSTASQRVLNITDEALRARAETLRETSRSAQELHVTSAQFAMDVRSLRADAERIPTFEAERIRLTEEMARLRNVEAWSISAAGAIRRLQGEIARLRPEVDRLRSINIDQISNSNLDR